MKSFIVMDAETKYYAHQVDGGWNNIYGMGLASAVTYSSHNDQYIFWTEKQKDQLCRYLNNQLVVTFNGITFDSILLLGNNRQLKKNGITNNDKYFWRNADVYVEMWRNIFNMDKSDYPEIINKISNQRFPKNVFNLDSIIKNTIRKEKNGHGGDAPDLYQKKILLKLFEYNLQDVRVLKELFLFIKEYKYLVTGNHDIVTFK